MKTEDKIKDAESVLKMLKDARPVLDRAVDPPLHSSVLFHLDMFEKRLEDALQDLRANL